MATLSPPDPSPSSSKMSRKWARKCERYCWIAFKYFPLVFVYSITTWAVWVESTIGFLPGSVESAWIGSGTSFIGVALYILLNWSYSVAVFTSPGTTTNVNKGYSSLPMYTPPVATSFTVKSNGELRFCKKCQATKPDRAHHCSTCRTCVLKMDHHCPWLANCVGLHNYKAFLLFLIYTSLFCILCCAVSSVWVWRELVSEEVYTESLMPINYVMLAVIAGIIGLVLSGFTGWHIMLASRGQTTIECLEKTRYLSPLRKQIHRTPAAEYHGDEERGYGNHMPEGTNGATAPEAPGVQEREQRFASYDAMARNRARERYEEYLDEQDSEKLPSAFDLGWKKNLLHLFGPRRALWLFPIDTTTGDGWSWEPSPKWLEARSRIASEREAQRLRERNAGWGEEVPAFEPPQRQPGAGRHYVSFPQSSPKADKILGRTPNDSFAGSYVDSQDSVSMRTLRPRRDENGYELSSDEEEPEPPVLDRKPTSGWPQRVGVVTNALLGNTLARQKDDVRGWDGRDDEVD